jgi:hypothetical protein
MGFLNTEALVVDVRVCVVLGMERFVVAAPASRLDAAFPGPAGVVERTRDDLDVFFSRVDDVVVSRGLDRDEMDEMDVFLRN